MAAREVQDSRSVEARHSRHASISPTYSISPEKRLVSVKFGKRLSFREIDGYAAGLRVDPRFDPGFSEVVDLSGVEELKLSAQEALRLADLVDPFLIGARRAFVARSQVQIRAARMHHLLRDDASNTRIFSSLSDAMKWIRR